MLGICTLCLVLLWVPSSSRCLLKLEVAVNSSTHAFLFCRFVCRMSPPFMDSCMASLVVCSPLGGWWDVDWQLGVQHRLGTHETWNLMWAPSMIWGDIFEFNAKNYIVMGISICFIGAFDVGYLPQYGWSLCVVCWTPLWAFCPTRSHLIGGFPAFVGQLGFLVLLDSSCLGYGSSLILRPAFADLVAPPAIGSCHDWRMWDGFN